MGGSRFIGRVGGLAIALGVGGAVLLGAECGTALADDAGTSGSAGGGSASGADAHPAGQHGSESGGKAASEASAPAPGSADTTKPSDPAPSTREDQVGDDDADASHGHDAEDVRKSSTRHRISKERTPDRTVSPTSSTEDSPTSTGDEPARNSAPAQQAAPSALPDVDVTVPTEPMSTRIEEPAAPEPPTSDPEPADGLVDVVSGVARTVSDLVASLRNPIAADDVPEMPAPQSQLWMTWAFARRETETAFAAPTLDQGREASVTGGVPLAAVPDSAQVADIASSLTYTAQPNFVDQVTVLGLRVLRAVSNAIGVDIFAQFNKLLISKRPPFFLTFGLDAQQSNVELTDGTVWKIWTFTPPDPTGKAVVAFHGSGFIYEPNVMQWYDYTSMARDTGATVIVPIYPLATTEAGSALNVVPDAADFVSRQIDRYGADNLGVYGDSAGSTIAVSAVRQLVLAGKPVPSSMVLLSLTPDGSLSNPDIQHTDDPVIDLDNLGDYATSHWLDGLTDPGDPLYNALHFETLAGLPPTTIYVGSLEFVLPDTLLLYDKAVAEGAPVSVVVGRGQIHDWPLGGLPINSQAPIVRPDIYRELGL